MISVSCVGQGFVGGSLSVVLAEQGVDVYVFDKAGKRAHGVNPFQATSIQELAEHCEQQEGFSGVFFIAVPTPMQVRGECDLSIVENCLRELAQAPRHGYTARVAVIKSTVIPGSVARWNQMFADKLSVVMNPEFLRESSALQDQRNQDRIILGGAPEAVEQVRKVFAHAFHNVPIFETTSTQAEMIKYITNTFLATKLSFANEIYQITEKLGINYNEVIELVQLDKRVGQSHWKVPSDEIGEDGKALRGWAKVCFPKDIKALTFLAKKLGVIPTMLEAAYSKNLEVRPSLPEELRKMHGRATMATRSFIANVVKPGVRIPMTNIQIPMVDLGEVGKEVLRQVFGD